MIVPVAAVAVIVAGSDAFVSNVARVLELPASVNLPPTVELPLIFPERLPTNVVAVSPPFARFALKLELAAYA